MIYIHHSSRFNWRASSVLPFNITNWCSYCPFSKGYIVTIITNLVLSERERLEYKCAVGWVVSTLHASVAPVVSIEDVHVTIRWHRATDERVSQLAADLVILQGIVL